MIAELKRIESDILPSLLLKPEIWNSVDVNYHPPRVQRLWTDIEGQRLSLHLIHPCETSEALWHPHPWPSVVHVVDGGYEMGVGYGPGDKLIKEVCKAWLAKGSYYEMLDPDGWHYVRPVDKISMSVMLMGKPWERWSPKSEEKLKPLDDATKKFSLAQFAKHFRAINLQNVDGILENLKSDLDAYFQNTRIKKYTLDCNRVQVVEWQTVSLLPLDPLFDENYYDEKMDAELLEIGKKYGLRVKMTSQIYPK